MPDIKLNNVTAPWFLLEEGRMVFSGTAYGVKGVAAFGLESAIFRFTSTVNPRLALWKLRRETGEDWVCHEVLWFKGVSADAVLPHIEAMFARAKPGQTGHTHEMDARYVLPLLRFCAKKAGIEGEKHLDFVRRIKAEETEHLQKRLIKAGVTDAVAEQYRVV